LEGGGGAGSCDFLIRRMSMISDPQHKISYKDEQNIQRITPTLMCHVLTTFHALFEGQPSSLQSMRTPEVPVRIRKQFPIDFSVIPDIQWINSGDRWKLIPLRQDPGTHLWTRINASCWLHLGFRPSFLTVLLRASVLFSWLIQCDQIS